MKNGKIYIKVIGVGGGGGNAVNHIATLNRDKADFYSVNTDALALERLDVDNKVQIGERLTQGLGSGAKPEIGRKAAEEDIDKIKEIVSDTDIIFLAAGLGGGTGTGASPVIAQAAKEVGALVIAVVTLPFKSEGAQRTKIAKTGLEEIRQTADSVVCIPNDRISEVADENITLEQAFRLTDNVLNTAFKAIAGLIIDVGIINIDYNDIKTVLSEKGDSLVCFGEADGAKSAVQAIRYAMANPFLNRNDIVGAKQVLISFVSGKNITMKDFEEATRIINTEIKREANIVFGVTIKPELESRTEVTLIATGLPELSVKKKNEFNFNRNFVQDTIDFFPAEKGLFVNMEPTLIDGVNFDTPTFIRWGRRKLMTTLNENASSPNVALSF